ncbi:MAG: fibronectin type III domain-containing protein, partial [Odoribacter sp.]|nr:fibronectin type III domain-containing protein [Odoribacter sp.]
MKIVKYFAGLFLWGSVLLAGCDDESGITPGEITDLTAESTPGRIVLRWNTPEEANIHYIEVKYYDPLLKKEVMRTASAYADSIEIPDTRAKYGEYHFTVQSISTTGDKSAVQNIAKVSEAADPTFGSSTQIVLTAADLSTNAQEPSEGPIANLLDGNTKTFFHTAWSVD